VGEPHRNGRAKRKEDPGQEAGDNATTHCRNPKGAVKITLVASDRRRGNIPPEGGGLIPVQVWGTVGKSDLDVSTVQDSGHYVKTDRGGVSKKFERRIAKASLTTSRFPAKWKEEPPLKHEGENT